MAWVLFGKRVTPPLCHSNAATTMHTRAAQRPPASTTYAGVQKAHVVNGLSRRNVVGDGDCDGK